MRRKGLEEQQRTFLGLEAPLVIAAERLKLEIIGALTLLTEGTVNLDVAAMLCVRARVYMVNRGAHRAYIPPNPSARMISKECTVRFMV